MGVEQQPERQLPSNETNERTIDPEDMPLLSEARSYAAMLSEQGEHSRLAEMCIKYFEATPETTFTEQEHYYLGHGWKAYIGRYGEQSLTLEEIVRLEKPTSGDIKRAIEGGIIKSSHALRVYGQLEREQTRSAWAKIVAKSAEEGDPQERQQDLQRRAALFIQQADERYLPLVRGEDLALVQYSEQEAAHQMNLAREQEAGIISDLDDTAAKKYRRAASWYEHAARMGREIPQGRPTRQRTEAQDDLREDIEEAREMDATSIREEIERGRWTDPEVVSLLVQKTREPEHSENKRASEIYPDQQNLEDMIPYCLQTAAERMDEGEYQRAFRWYDMTARLVARRMASKPDDQKKTEPRS